MTAFRTPSAQPETHARNQYWLPRSLQKINPASAVYCMSKAALIHMTPAMALEWGRYDITVNAICRGYIDTEMTHHL
jgi:NAD(P)-dependent dehydrogenase (short-subunit alcohol dehydrogenase family)